MNINTISYLNTIYIYIYIDLRVKDFFETAADFSHDVRHRFILACLQVVRIGQRRCASDR